MAIEYRTAEHYDRLPALAAALVRRPVTVMYTTGDVASLVAKTATAITPIVFAMGEDPIQAGLVVSLNRPGGNITGVSFFSGTLAAKRLEYLRELIPQTTTIAFLVNPANVRTEIDKREMRAAVRSVGQQIIVVGATTASEIDNAFEEMLKQRVGALLVSADAYFNARREQLVALAARYAIPASYNTREYAAVGGLMSYGDDRLESYRLAGTYVGRILKGEKAGDLPVQQPTKFQFVINLKTAKALGLTVPPTLLARADEVIE